MKNVTNDELPDGWTICEIGEISPVIGGGTPPSKNPQNFSDKGGIPWITPADLSGYSEIFISRGKRNLTERGFSESSAKMLPKGALLFSSRAPVGYVAIASNPVCTNQGFKSFVLPEGFDSRFGYFYLRHIKPLADARATGTTFKELSGGAASHLPFIFAPLAEQKRIADKLEAVLGRVDACRARLDRVPALLKRFRQSVLAAAIAGELTKEWRELHPDIEPGSKLLEQILNAKRKKHTGKGAYKEPDFHSATRLPAIPNSWTWAGIRQVGEVQLGRQRAPQHHSGDNMRPYLRVANVFEDRFDLKDVKSMNFTPDEFGRYCLKYGDILLNEGQTPELVGRPAMYRNEIPNCCYQKTLHRFRAFEGLLPQFALTVFRAYMHNGRFTDASSITTSIAHLTQQSFVKIEFPLPPLPEQQEIVRRVEALFSMSDRIEARLSTAQKTVERLTPATLAKAFRGELVPQDPNDESAGALLERLKKTASASSATQTRRKRTVK